MKNINKIMRPKTNRATLIKKLVSTSIIVFFKIIILLNNRDVVQRSEPSDCAFDGSDLISVMNGSQLFIPQMRSVQSIRDLTAPSARIIAQYSCCAAYTIGSLNQIIRGLVVLKIHAFFSLTFQKWLMFQDIKMWKKKPIKRDRQSNQTMISATQIEG